jgi:hypothetical protein
MAAAEIVESYFEYNAKVSNPMFAAWTLPNALVAALFPILKAWDVEPGDISWNKESASFQDLQVTFNVSRLRAIIKVGIESIVCIGVNPDWSEAPALVDLFQVAIGAVCKTGHTEIASHEDALAMHVTPGDKNFREIMAKLVSQNLLGSAQMYGASVYREDSSLVLDKSVRYKDALFVRLHRTLPIGIDFMQVAKILFDDEVRTLRLLGLETLIEELPGS